MTLVIRWNTPLHEALKLRLGDNAKRARAERCVLSVVLPGDFGFQHIGRGPPPCPGENRLGRSPRSERMYVILRARPSSPVLLPETSCGFCCHSTEGSSSSMLTTRNHSRNGGRAKTEENHMQYFYDRNRCGHVSDPVQAAFICRSVSRVYGGVLR